MKKPELDAALLTCWRNGSITLHLPDDFSAELTATTGHGDFSFDFPVEVEGRMSDILPVGAETMAHAAVQAHLAACVQMEPIRSTYRWQGAVETSDEVRLPGKPAAVNSARKPTPEEALSRARAAASPAGAFAADARSLRRCHASRAAARQRSRTCCPRPRPRTKRVRPPTP